LYHHSSSIYSKVRRATREAEGSHIRVRGAGENSSKSSYENSFECMDNIQLQSNLACKWHNLTSSTIDIDIIRRVSGGQVEIALHHLGYVIIVE